MASVSVTRRIAGLARIAMALLGLATTFSVVSPAAATSFPLAGRQVSGFAELLLPTGASEPAEDAALAAALATYEEGGEPRPRPRCRHSWPPTPARLGAWRC
jgi:hypothetical protein